MQKTHHFEYLRPHDNAYIQRHTEKIRHSGALFHYNIIRTSSQHHHNIITTSSKHHHNVITTSSNIITTSSKHHQNIINTTTTAQVLSEVCSAWRVCSRSCPSFLIISHHFSSFLRSNLIVPGPRGWRERCRIHHFEYRIPREYRFFLVFDTKFIFLLTAAWRMRPAQFIIFNTSFLVFNAKFIIFDTKSIIFTHKRSPDR